MVLTPRSSLAAGAALMVSIRRILRYTKYVLSLPLFTSGSFAWHLLEFLPFSWIDNMLRVIGNPDFISRRTGVHSNVFIARDLHVENRTDSRKEKGQEVAFLSESDQSVPYSHSVAHWVVNRTPSNAEAPQGSSIVYHHRNGERYLWQGCNHLPGVQDPVEHANAGRGRPWVKYERVHLRSTSRGTKLIKLLWWKFVN